MKTNDDEIVLVLAPFDHGHTDDSKQITADCGHEAWIAVTGHKMWSDPDLSVRTVCLRCVDVDELHEQVQTQGLRSPPGARGELNKTLGVGATDQLFTFFGIQEGLPEEKV